MQALTRVVLRHRIVVFVFWFLVLVAGLGASSQLGDRLSTNFALPGQEGYETQQALVAAYGTTADAAAVPVVTVPDGSTVTEHRADVQAVFDAVRKLPGVRVADFGSTADPAFVTKDGRSAFAIVYAPRPQGFADPRSKSLMKALTEAVTQTAKAHGLSSGVTGYQQLAAGSADSGGPSILTETLLGAAGAFAVLLFVFASLLAFLPLLIAAVSILATFLIVLGLTTFADVSFVVQFLISLVGLGIAIDYSLLVVSRWREERAKGADNRQAILTASSTAGSAVLASGLTVAISLIALVVIPVPLLQSMGYGGMLIPVVSVAVVLTLLPAMLSMIGPRMDYPKIRKEGVASRGWTAWAAGIVRFRWAAAGLAVVLLGFAIAPALSAQFGLASTGSLAANGPAVDSLHLLGKGGIGTGVVTPAVVLTRGDAQAVADAARQVPGVLAVSVAQPGKNGLTAVDVIPKGETVDSSSVTVVDNLRAAVAGKPGYAGITGAGATIVDYRHAVYDRFPYVIALIALITFVLLVRTFRSILLPLKAVLLNLVSLAAVFGAATWFWQQGHGSKAVFDIAATGAMTFWIPPLIFAFLFGLSMDYEVFILARMREEYDATGSTKTAVIQGLGRTGRLITSAALILFFAFIALTGTPGTDVKVFATALGAGILIDATIVRALLVPALVSLFGRWNWYLPGWLASVLRVEPSPLAPRGEAPPIPAQTRHVPEKEAVTDGV